MTDRCRRLATAGTAPAAVERRRMQYLGLDKKITWYRECKGDAVCVELMDYILSHGNFGRKDISKDAVKVIRKWDSLADGFRYAQLSGKHIYFIQYFASTQSLHHLHGLQPLSDGLCWE